MLTSPGRPAVRLLVVALAAATALLAGCSGDGGPSASGPRGGSGTPGTSGAATSAPTTQSGTSPTVAEVYRAARTASLSAESGHAKGAITRDGTTMGIDVQGLANGSNQTLQVTTPKGGTAEVLTVGEGYWAGGDETHWADVTGNRKGAKALVGKYAKVTESEATAQGSITLRSLLTDAFARPELSLLESDTGAASETRVDGVPAYVLGPEGGPRLWVAADGSGTLLRLTGPKSDPSDLTFSDWGRAPTFTEPPPDKVTEN